MVNAQQEALVTLQKAIAVEKAWLYVQLDMLNRATPMELRQFGYSLLDNASAMRDAFQRVQKSIFAMTRAYTTKFPASSHPEIADV